MIVGALSVGGICGWFLATRVARARVQRELGEYRAMVQSANDAMLLVEDGRIVECNPAAETLHGLSRDELIGRGPADISPAFQQDGRSSASAAVAYINEALAGQPQRFIWQHKRGGGVFSAEVALTPAVSRTDSGKARFVAVLRDVTERQQAAQDLLDSEERFRKLFELAPIPLALMSPQGQLLHTNTQWVHMIGYTQADVPSLSEWWSLAYPDADYRARMVAVWQVGIQNIQASGGEFKPTQVRVRCKDGKTRELIAGGAVVGQNILVSFYDITEQQAAQDALASLNATLEEKVKSRTSELLQALEDLQRTQGELVRSEKMASLGALVAGVAHELNTLIGNAVIVASTQSDLLKRFEGEVAQGLKKSTLTRFMADLREATDVMERNLRRAAELITGFKQVAVDQSSYQRRPFDLGEVMRELHITVSPTLRRNGVTLEAHAPNGLQMDSYPGPLTQVVMNLINNAVAHAFEQQADPKISISCEVLDDQRVRIGVRDNGCGIPPEHLRRVFDPFFTTKMGRGGSGLGLHIVYSLVSDLLGGTVDLHSEVGQGTVVTLDLPRHAPQPQS